MSKLDATFGKIIVMNKIFLYFDTCSYFISRRIKTKTVMKGRIAIRSFIFVKSAENCYESKTLIYLHLIII